LTESQAVQAHDRNLIDHAGARDDRATLRVHEDDLLAGQAVGSYSNLGHGDAYRGADEHNFCTVSRHGAAEQTLRGGAKLTRARCQPAAGSLPAFERLAKPPQNAILPHQPKYQVAHFSYRIAEKSAEATDAFSSWLVIEETEKRDAIGANIFALIATWSLYRCSAIRLSRSG
jgi:hypothetical protein